MARKMKRGMMREEEGDDEDEEENGQWRSSLARFCEDGEDEGQ